MDFINPHESRWALLTRGLQDFLHHPVFGVGLGNQKTTTSLPVYRAAWCFTTTPAADSGQHGPDGLGGLRHAAVGAGAPAAAAAVRRPT